jgi:hypothetical protein
MRHARERTVIRSRAIALLPFMIVAALSAPTPLAFADECAGPLPDGTECDDGLYCNGTPDQCQGGECIVHPGLSCDDGEACTDETCDEMLDSCIATPVINGTPCDDEDSCSRDDVCADGVCAGSPIALFDLCPWAVVLSPDPRGNRLTIDLNASIDGDVCGGNVRIGSNALVNGGVASSSSAGTKELQLASTSFIAEDIVSLGAGAGSRPSGAALPHLAVPLSALPPGSITAKVAPPGGFYDLSGGSPVATACQEARNSYTEVELQIDALPSIQSMAAVKLPRAGSLTINPTTAGEINVISLDSLRTGADSIIELNGGGNSDTVFVLRVLGSLRLGLRSGIVLAGGLTPEKLLFHVKGKTCRVGNFVTGAGTLFCTGGGGIRMQSTVEWTGAIFGAGRRLHLGDANHITHVQFAGF